MKQSLLSSWHSVTTTLAMTVGSPSAHRRGTMLKPLFLAMLFLIAGIGNVWGVTYTKVTDDSTLESGDEIIIVCESKNDALSTTQNNKNRGVQSVTINTNTNTITDPGANVQVITLGTATKTENNKQVTYWTLGVGTNKWLYAASSSENQLKTQSTLDDNGKWSISISSGDATITAKGTNTRNLLKHNSSSGLYACYGSGQAAVQIYKKGGSQQQDVFSDHT